MGPITIFDKSALQSLSMDESVWLDAFFLVNVVPLFYVETLADLEKTMAEGKSPEDLVGMLAAKTPPNAAPNVHHRSLISAELTGWSVPMDGRIPIAGGDMMRGAQGETGVHVEEFAEAVALNRWKNHEFLEIEREMARQWRAELADHDQARTVGIVRNIVPAGRRLPDLVALKQEIDSFCTGNQRETVALALDVLGVPEASARSVLARWEASGRPPLERFAPYTTHVFKVDLLYYLGIARGFISGERASNKADMAYLYYLPFCMVFTSGDKLHQRTAPLLLRADQSFVPAPDFKASLKELDVYYDHFPEEVKALGVMAFAHTPPPHLDNLVVELWNAHLSASWQERAETPEQVLARWRATQEESGTLDGVRGRLATARPMTTLEQEPFDGEPDYVVIKRLVPTRKGKWRLVPEEVADSEGDDVR